MSTPVRNTMPQARTVYLKDYRSPAFLIDRVDLNVELYDDYALVHAVLTIRRNPASKTNPEDLALKGELLTLEAIKINQQVIEQPAYQVTPHELIIKNVPDSFQLNTTVKIYPQKNTALSGLYRSAQTFCTQCEAEGFRRITYYLDQPDVLAKFTTTISADRKRYPIMLSNGNLVGSGELEQGRHWVKWEDPFKKPSYLFALVAGDFDLLQDKFITMSNRSIHLNIYVEKGYGDQVGHAMYSLKEAMRWDEETYGREYDLDTYMIVAIGDFNMGAMENKGLNIFNTKYILAKPETATDQDYIHILSVIGHEYFHNWSGNRVTCRDWFQLSLKEGLTIFRDQTFTEDRLSHAVMRIQEVTALRETQFPEDAGPLAHPVRPESYIEINNFYTTTIYNKGAEVLRMLRTILGQPQFRKAMDLYFERFDAQAVTIEDYISVMEEVSGFNLQQFRLWYSQAGTPTVHVTDDYDPVKKLYTLTFHQTLSPTPGQSQKKPLVIPIRMGILDETGKTVPLQREGESVAVEKVLILTDAAQMFHFENVPSRPIPSLLRDFSAPVHLQYEYSDSDLLFLVKHDVDAFNRFEAVQKYALRLFHNLILDYQKDQPLNVPETFIEMYDFLLSQEVKDHFLLAEMLTLPSERITGEQMTIIDVNAIHYVHEKVLITLATQLDKKFLALYERYHYPEKDYHFSMQAVGQRQLKNRCLAFLLRLPQYEQKGVQQFNDALNKDMTDTQAALHSLVNLESEQREIALDKFYVTFKNDALVIDKWLAVQAASQLPNTLQQVKKLSRHEAFNLKNPNKVFALIGTFGFRNQIAFHIENGEGYAFLRDTVQQLDKLNPQVAARMVKPLTTWKRYDKERQALMREQLSLLLQDNKLSKDVFEIVSKSLEEEVV